MISFLWLDYRGNFSGEEEEVWKERLNYLNKIIWLRCKERIRIVKGFIRENKWLRISNIILKIKKWGDLFILIEKIWYLILILIEKKEMLEIYLSIYKKLVWKKWCFKFVGKKGVI